MEICNPYALLNLQRRGSDVPAIIIFTISPGMNGYNPMRKAMFHPVKIES